MARILVKSTKVDFGPALAPGGARILEVLKAYTSSGMLQDWAKDVFTITSARDGTHSGPNDPHHFGNAFDIRTHGLSPGVAQALLDHLIHTLGARFYAFIEYPGLPEEHIHVQVTKGTTYGIMDYLRNA